MPTLYQNPEILVVTFLSSPALRETCHVVVRYLKPFVCSSPQIEPLATMRVPVPVEATI